MICTYVAGDPEPYPIYVCICSYDSVCLYSGLNVGENFKKCGNLDQKRFSYKGILGVFFELLGFLQHFCSCTHSERKFQGEMRHKVTIFISACIYEHFRDLYPSEECYQDPA